MQALLDAGLPVAAVISNQAGAAGLAIAASRGVPTAVVPQREFATRDAFDAALAAAIDEFSPRLLALAGFMRILTPAFAARYAGRMVNIHPSLLPAFAGLDTHARALGASPRAVEVLGREIRAGHDRPPLRGGNRDRTAAPRPDVEQSQAGERA